MEFSPSSIAARFVMPLLRSPCKYGENKMAGWIGLTREIRSSASVSSSSLISSDVLRAL